MHSSSSPSLARLDATHARPCARADSPADAAKSTWVFDWPLRVYYEDTDAAGVVYYANYLRFCERARTEMLRCTGHAQQDLLQQQGIGFVVRSLQAEYLAPARLDDALCVRSRIVGSSGASLEFEQKIYLHSDDADPRRPLFSAIVRLACVDLRRGRPIRLPAELCAALIRASAAA